MSSDSLIFIISKSCWTTQACSTNFKYLNISWFCILKIQKYYSFSDIDTVNWAMRNSMNEIKIFQSISQLQCRECITLYYKVHFPLTLINDGFIHSKTIKTNQKMKDLNYRFKSDYFTN
nr:hypothetical protein SPAC17C9.04c - fission yeast (Schizosaccharomyces pombe) [Schizosaccharomyces pombe]